MQGYVNSREIMDKKIGKTNVTFGWCWLFIGILEAIWIGLFAFQEEWLGGYTTLARRFLRLSHIAIMALSLTNILYGLCIDSITLPLKVKKTGSFAMIIAAIFMPSLCLLSIVNKIFQSFFFIPAVSFAIAIFIIALGQFNRD